MDYVPRRQEAELAHLLEEDIPARRVILVEGARQTGKTTLVKHVLQKLKVPAVSLDLERHSLIRSRIDETRQFSEFEQLLSDEFDFDSHASCVLFIDEAQESLKLGSYVRFMKEAWPRTKVVLSGSTLSRIFKADVRYPVGRVKRLVVRPFSFAEFLSALGKNRLAENILEDPRAVTPSRHQTLLGLLNDYLAVGGLPDVLLAHASGADYRRRRAEIIADYEQDFIRLFGEETIAIVKACFSSVANFVGSPSKNSSVVPAPTNRINDEIRRVFARLEDWRLVLRSEQRGPSPEASHRYLPKRYLFDTGVLRSFREKAVPSIDVLSTLNAAERRPLGGIIENQVAIELAFRTGELAGWKKTPSGLEIDFIARFADKSYPIECKAISRIKKTHLRGMFEYLNLYGQRTGFVISFAPYEEIRGPGNARIISLPLYLAEEFETVVARSVCD